MKKLGEMLLESGLINSVQLNDALTAQKKTGGRIGTILVKMGHLSEDRLYSFLAEQYGLEYYSDDDFFIPMEMQKRVKFDFIKRYGVIPFKISEGKLYLGINDLSGLSELEEINAHSKMKVVPVLLNFSMYDKILADFIRIGYGVADYRYEPIGKYVTERMSFFKLMEVVFKFDSTIQQIYLAEGSSPLVQKVTGFFKLSLDVLTKEQLLSFIKELTDENMRKGLLTQNILKVKREFNGRIVTIVIIKHKTNYIITVNNITEVVPDFDIIGFDQNLMKLLTEHSSGLYIVVAPFGHGKSTVFSSLISYLNKNKVYNILSLEKKVSHSIKSDKSLVTQVETGYEEIRMRESIRLMYELNPDILFVSNLDDITVLDSILKFAESGRKAFVSIEASSFSAAISSMVFRQKENLAKHYLEKVADNLKMMLNIRFVPVKTVEKKRMVYEYMINSTKLKKIIRDSSLYIINSQIKGSNEFIPIEKKLAEMFIKNIIDYDTGVIYSNDAELFKTFAANRQA